MDMNKAFFARKEDSKPRWRLIDANGVILGKLATKVANALRGKDKPNFTPHADIGDYVVVVNADKIVLTGNKWEGKEYARYTGWIGGYKVTKAKDMLVKHPTHIVELAVRGMLPKNKLSREAFRKLKVYAGSEHPHTAQIETSKKLQEVSAEKSAPKKVAKRASKKTQE